MGVSGGLSGGAGVTVGASVAAGAGLAIGCDDGYVKMGFVVGSAVQFDVSLGPKVSGGPGLSASFEVQVFLPTHTGGASGKAWGNIAGAALGFGVGASGAIGLGVSAGFTVYTSLPVFNFGCLTKDICGDHLSECVTILGQ